MPKKKFNQSDSVEIRLTPQNKIRTKPKKFKFSPKQVHLLDILLNPENSIVFISGPAGTSKTFLALYAAIDLMSNNPEKSLLYVRSIIESADQGLGSLPGDIAEKFDPFLMPLYDKMEEIVVPQDVVSLKSEGRISAMPINFMRGASWVDKIVVADEAQNFTFKELTTLITRIGVGSKLIICGDCMQSDIGSKTGFSPMLKIFNDQESKEKGIQTFFFAHEDIVRSEILRFLIKKLESNPFPV
jgi:phosphate starvation-inducible PhoH-like protein